MFFVSLVSLMAGGVMMMLMRRMLGSRMGGVMGDSFLACCL